MIKTYPDRAAHDAAAKSEMESAVALIENVNEIAIDGVNVVTSQPKVGDIVCHDENRQIRFIALDTYQGGVFPAAWETVGVVVLRKGNQVKVASKNNEVKRFMEVYPYVVTGYELDGMEHTAQLRLHGKPTTSTYYDFTYTASDADGFVTALQQFLSDNGETGWSAYKDEDGSVILQYDDYNSAEYYSTAITYASGLTLTAKVVIDYPEQTPIWQRKCGTKGNAVWNIERAKTYFRSDLASTAYNPASDVSSIPSYPVCWPAFAGTSQYQEDHCLWLRQQYCKDPAHPTEEEWEAYIEDLTAVNHYMTGGASPKWRDGKALSDMVKDVTYRAADGTRKMLYPGIVYCSQFMDGKGYLPSFAEFEETFRNVTYGLAGVERDKSDAINRSLYAIGGSAVQNTVTWWVSGRFSTYAAWNALSTGCTDGNYFYFSLRCIPVTLLELPSGND